MALVAHHPAHFHPSRPRQVGEPAGVGRWAAAAGEADIDVSATRKMIESTCQGLEVKVSELSDPDQSFWRFRLDGGWPICTLTFKGKTSDGKESLFEVDLSDGC